MTNLKPSDNTLSCADEICDEIISPTKRLILQLEFYIYLYPKQVTKWLTGLFLLPNSSPKTRGFIVISTSLSVSRARVIFDHLEVLGILDPSAVPLL